MNVRSIRSASAVLCALLAALGACKDKPTASAVTESSAAPPVASALSTPSAAAPTAEPSATAVAEPPPSAPTATASATAKPKTASSNKDKTNKDKTLSTPASSATATPAATTKLDAPAPGSADEVAQKLDDLFVPKKTYSAKFKQEYVSIVANQTKTSSGTVFVEKPNKISFRYDPPNKNRIVSDGNLLKIYVAEDQQMMQSPVQKTEYPGALSFLMGHGLRPSFTFKFNDKVKYDKGPVLYGKPRDATPYYDYVQFWVDKTLLDAKDPNAITKVLIVDAQGNKNRFEFEGATIPDAIDKSEFQFTPPEGTDIKNNP